jgi:DNA-binding MarR family transcriptional regulator
MTLRAEPSTPPDALRVAGGLLLLVRALEQQLRAGASPDALGLKDLGVLGQIERGVDQPSLLARTLRLDPARVTHVTDRLVTQGYVRRTIDEADRRRWRLYLTPQGEQRLHEGRAEVRAAMETLLCELDVEERVALSQGLEGVRRVLGTKQ